MIYSVHIKLSLSLRVCFCVKEFFKDAKVTVLTGSQLKYHETQITEIKAQHDPQ